MSATPSPLNTFTKAQIAGTSFEMQTLTTYRCECGFLSHNAESFLQHGIREHQWPDDQQLPKLQHSAPK